MDEGFPYGHLRGLTLSQGVAFASVLTNDPPLLLCDVYLQVQRPAVHSSGAMTDGEAK